MLVDSHCHLDFPDFAEEMPEVLQRAEEAGVGLMLTICTRVRNFAPILALAEAHEQVYCSVGTHPNNASDDDEKTVTVEELVELAAHPKVVAIGEAGLDYHYDSATPADQATGLRVHIEAARQTGLPLVIHSRDADEDMAALLTEEYEKGAYSAILHCYSSGEALARAGLALGFYVSFSGILTFKNAQSIRDIAAIVPHDRLLVETDAPYLAPTPYRGKRNEPSYVVETAKVLAQTVGLSEEELVRQTTANVQRLFAKLPSAAFSQEMLTK